MIIEDVLMALFILILLVIAIIMVYNSFVDIIKTIYKKFFNKQPKDKRHKYSCKHPDHPRWDEVNHRLKFKKKEQM